MSRLVCLRLVLMAQLTAGAVFAQDKGPEASPTVPEKAAPASPAGHDGHSKDDLAMAAANPLANLVTVPFQFNWDQPVGPTKSTRFALNIMPVLPFALSDRVNLITRLIIPLVSQPALSDTAAPTFGMADILASFWVSPNWPGSFTWGVGPAMSLPSATEATLGSGTFAIGPTAVILKQAGPWTVGALWNQVWGVTGATSTMFIQPFVSYVTRDHWTFTLNSETFINWKADDRNRWSVPINFMITKLASFGPFPASYVLGAGVYAVSPEIGPTWKIRAAIIILLPLKKAG
jgi:hypothetical protein